jgi:DNA polymerase-1
VSSVVMLALAGKPGAARVLMDGWDDLSDEDKEDNHLEAKCGTAFLAFGGGKDGRACQS